MKKRILSILLMSAMLLGMTGCNSGTEKTEVATESAEVTTTVAEEKKEATETTKEAVETEATTTTAETEATTTTTTTTEEVIEEPVIMPLIDREPEVYEVMNFNADGKQYMYHFEENNIYEVVKNISCQHLDGDYVTHINSYKEWYNYKTGNYLIQTELCETGGFSKNATIISMEDIYSDFPWLVYEEEEDFSGKTTFYGYVDIDGTWLIPKTADDNGFIEEIKNAYTVMRNNYICYSKATSNNTVDFVFYFFKEDRTVTFEGMLVNGKQILYFFEENLVLQDDNKTLYFYNLTTGEERKILENARKVTLWFYNPEQKNENIIEFFSEQYKTYSFDLSEYNIKEIHQINENMIRFVATNPEGTKFHVVTKNDGTTLVEPTKDYIPYICGNSYIICSGVENCIINIETGEKTPYEYRLVSCNFKIGDTYYMLVESDKAYYFVDPAAPETLINPFEKADNIYTLN